MSENNTAVETPAVFKVQIRNVADFRAVAPVFNIKVADGPGAMPKRQLLLAVREAVKAGKAELVETDYFGVDAVLSGAGTTSTAKGGWKISYRVVNAETGKVDGPVLSFEVDKDKIKSVVPDASFVGKFNGVLALVMVAHREGASVAEFKNYVVTDVTRVDALTVVETTDNAPKGDDTEEGKTDADKAPEHVPVEVIEAAIKTGEAEVKVEVPELVPATATAKRNRKPAAKTAK